MNLVWNQSCCYLDTNIENEKAYTEHVTDFVRHNNLAEAIYIFEAFDESEKPGADTERHFGIMVRSFRFFWELHLNFFGNWNSIVRQNTHFSLFNR